MSAPTARQLAARHVRKLRTIRAKLIDMASQWDGLDQFNLGELERLADQAEKVAADLTAEELES